MGQKPSECGNQLAISEISQVHELASQLRLVLLSSSPSSSSLRPPVPAGSSAELAQEILDKLMKCSAMALSSLQQSCACHQLPSEKRKNSPERDMPHGHKRRKTHNSWYIVTSVPFDDGHHWRKYGNKIINNAKYQRSYYRCIHCKDQGCPATKTVQQVESDADPPLFTVVYHMQHSCNSTIAKIAIYVMESSESDGAGGRRNYHLPPPSSSTTGSVNQSQSNSPSSMGDQEKNRVLISQELPPIGSPAGFGDEIANALVLPADYWSLDNIWDPVLGFNK